MGHDKPREGPEGFAQGLSKLLIINLFLPPPESLENVSETGRYAATAAIPSNSSSRVYGFSANPPNPASGFCHVDGKTAPCAPLSVNVAPPRAVRGYHTVFTATFFGPSCTKTPLLRAKRGTGGSQAPDIQRIANNPLRKKRRGLYVSGSVSAACLPPPAVPIQARLHWALRQDRQQPAGEEGPCPEPTGAHRSRPFLFQKSGNIVKNSN